MKVKINIADDSEQWRSDGGGGGPPRAAFARDRHKVKSK